jgi:hypothetical protein
MTWLYVTQSKEASSTTVDVINPAKGRSAAKDVEVLARRLGEEDESALMDPASVQQLIAVCFD